ncbi:DUF4352 domain-containing protein [Streptomyces europaeiscabiei]|uniref:DUF4352 domain-containing protein n=1 Tax=Streptomyces europaeiscabiei TaxID=146819 RepID=UPI0029A2A4DA|nr:DUF4352 domain-containing protein [Streptomyces europaeiscabiei]MDX3634803.1 DUF4352 domain-containing protein [Streptomyces europaeiscabiei]MDX3652759.1 DUF4352 domain-containing protein [Streptomyces europaeiscabiei]
MKRSHTNTIIISTAAVLIAGIVTAGIVVSNAPDRDPKPTVVKAASTPSASSTKTSPSPSPSQETLKLGDKVDIDAGGHKFSAAVLAHKDKGIRSPVGLFQDGQKLALVEVKVCNEGEEPITVAPFTWSLAYEDGSRLEPFHMTGSELPPPVYPMDAKVKGGDCVRGNVFFEVPKGFGRAERVLYSPGDLDEPVEWKIGK